MKTYNVSFVFGKAVIIVSVCSDTEDNAHDQAIDVLLDEMDIEVGDAPYHEILIEEA
jgi:hypothetical protein